MGLQIYSPIVSAVNVDQLPPAHHFFLPFTAAMIIFMINQNIILMGWPRPSPAAGGGATLYQENNNNNATSHFSFCEKNHWWRNLFSLLYLYNCPPRRCDPITIFLFNKGAYLNILTVPIVYCAGSPERRGQVEVQRVSVLSAGVQWQITKWD